MRPALAAHWYCAAIEKTIASDPVAVSILETPIVLFRDGSGTVRALLDRCAHRAAPLSAGSVRKGCLTCPYHGWSFQGTGECVDIPALPRGESIPSGYQVPVLPVRVEQGLVWVWMGEASSQLPDILAFPGHGQAGWGHVTFESHVEADVEEVIENFVDCPHTGFVHGGLFRGEPDHDTVARIRQVPGGIDIRLEEPGQSDSFLARILARGRTVEHVDRFRLPATVHVHYRFGPDLEFHGFQICTPVGTGVTRVFVHVAWRAGLFTSILAPFVRLVGARILAQDRTILEAQAKTIQRFGRQNRSTRADAATVWINRLRRGELPEHAHELEVRFRL